MLKPHELMEIYQLVLRLNKIAQVKATTQKNSTRTQKKTFLLDVRRKTNFDYDRR